MAGQRDFWITNTGQLTRLQRRLDAVARQDWRANLNRRIRHAAQPIKDDLVGTMRGLRIWGPGGSGRSGPTTDTRPLRATLAAAIRLSVTTGGGTRIWVDKGRLDPDLQSMPGHLNKGHWRHRVFGSRRRWVDQYAEADWWWNTVRPHMPRLNEQVARILDDVQRQLNGA